MNCIFCKIINGETPSYTLYEDEYVKAFLDIYPDTNGHTLIIPKEHYLDISDIPIETLTHINSVAKKMYTLLNNKLNMDGITIIQNNGSAQDIKHYHLHLLPRYKDNQTKLKIEDIYKKLTDES